MALDTGTRQFSALNLGSPWRGINALPSGALDEEEQFSLLYLYNEFAAGSPADSEPVFIGPSVGTIVTLANVAMASIDFSLRFTHATDTPTYGLTGTLPAGVTFTGSTLSGTPTETGTFAGLVVTATDDDLDTAVSDTFTIRVVTELANIRPYRGLRGKGVRNYW